MRLGFMWLGFMWLGFMRLGFIRLGVMQMGPALFVLVLPAAAAAQGKGRVVTITEVTIVGRVQKPIASVDVSRIQPKLALAELAQPFVGRIEKALRKPPF